MFLNLNLPDLSAYNFILLALSALELSQIEFHYFPAILLGIVVYAKLQAWSTRVSHLLWTHDDFNVSVLTAYGLTAFEKFPTPVILL